MSTPEPTLKDKTAKGLLWGGVSNGVQQVLNMVFGICLARLLTPDDYGMVGMLYIFSLIASTLQESGFTAALTNKKEISHADYNAVFWFSVLTGTLLYVVLFFCAPLIAAYYHKPQLTPLSRYLFLSFVISSIGIAHNAYLFRNLRVKQNAIITMTSLILSGVVGVSMAFAGMAYWGLATQSMAFVTCVTIGRWWLSGFRPTFSINLRPLGSMLAFSSKILFANIVTNINNNILSVILGRYYSAKEVGYYNQANKWNCMGYFTIQNMVNGVAQPVLHNVADDRERHLRVFRKMLRFTAFISFPCMFGLALVAPQLITITVTDKWAASASLLQIICIGGAILPIQNLYSNLILSKGRSDLCLWNNILLGGVQIVAVLLCCRYGMHALVQAYVGINILWIFVWHYLVWREIRLSLLDVLKDILPYAFIAGIIMLAVHYTTQGLHNVYLLFAVRIVVAALLYILCMQLSGSATYRECLQYLFKKKR